jgi:hypothetical protein
MAKRGPASPLAAEATIRYPLSHSERRVGGEVTQRIANPCRPVRFRYPPPENPNPDGRLLKLDPLSLRTAPHLPQRLAKHQGPIIDAGSTDAVMIAFHQRGFLLGLYKMREAGSKSRYKRVKSVKKRQRRRSAKDPCPDFAG